MQGKNKPLLRYLDTEIIRLAAKKHSGLIFGPRQVGKTTLVQNILKNVENKIEYFLQNPSMRQEIEADPSKIIRQTEAFGGKSVVFVD